MMKIVFPFHASRERYTCDAAVVWCFDHRFNDGFTQFLRQKGVQFPDPIKIAGGAKSLASPENEAEREFVLEQIRKSIRLHQTRRVILKLHSDCGAYGGLEAFGNDRAREAEHHQQELRRAAAFLAKTFPGIEIEAYYVDFDGVWEVGLAPSVSS